MRVLVDITHPAHFHFFRPAIEIWREAGDEVTIVARDKDVTLRLLDNAGYSYVCLSKIRKGLVGLGIELLEHEAKLLNVIRKARPQVMMQIGGTFIVHAGFLTRTPCVVFSDTEHASLANRITYPFATRIVTPECYQGDLGRKHIRYPGYQELAYLHPNRFQPDESVLDSLGMNRGDRFFVLRFVSWGASHDAGQRGFSDRGRREFIEYLTQQGRVLVSSEADLPPDLQRYRFPLSPTKMHDVLAFATMFIGEGGTMATEAAVLGTPAIFVSTLQAGTWQELRERYELLCCYSEEHLALEKARELVARPHLRDEWNGRRERMLQDKIDVTDFLLQLTKDNGSPFCMTRTNQETLLRGASQSGSETRHDP